MFAVFSNKKTAEASALNAVIAGYETESSISHKAFEKELTVETGDKHFQVASFEIAAASKDGNIVSATVNGNRISPDNKDLSAVLKNINPGSSVSISEIKAVGLKECKVITVNALPIRIN